MDKETKAKLKQSSKETGCQIPFSRRKFAIMALIAKTVLEDEELLEGVALTEKVKVTNGELDDLQEELTEFWSV